MGVVHVPVQDAVGKSLANRAESVGGLAKTLVSWLLYVAHGRIPGAIMALSR
jgi:hypothetical protein